MKCLPTFEFEEMLRRGGVEYIAGVDEAGRGPVAGPVTAAAVILPIGKFIENVRDSKQLTGNQRESVAAAIKENAIDFSVAHIPNETIDSINILNATRLAVLKAIESLKIKPQVILIDGKFLNLKNMTCISIVKGDSTIFSIAAASILAKTSRDALMLRYAEDFPLYSFEKNKGYLTMEHLQAIRAHGYSLIHRKSFSISL
ncbi:MAG: ribonuclease HII [Bacteroidetes bacterium]|nr:ribonuclease HII [Bacteroidota bacterium]MCL5737979.1 ribonuclease HII [Bacteroidota bacterium]